MSKGDKQRPRQVSNDEYATRWDAIWGKDDSDKQFRMDADTCSICGEKMTDGICPKLIEQQKERT